MVLIFELIMEVDFGDLEIKSMTEITMIRNDPNISQDILLFRFFFIFILINFYCLTFNYSNGQFFVGLIQNSAKSRL